MLLPSEKPLFENVGSNEYFTRGGQLQAGEFNGIVQIVFSDFEEAVVFSKGKAVAGVHEAKRWLTVSDDLVDAVENKAMAVPGRMTAYPLDPGLLQVFIHKNVKTMVETELGKYLTPRLLLGYLAGDVSTCILKLYDDKGTGYVFMNAGKRAGAVYGSAESRSYGENAVKDMDRFKEHTAVAIYYIEPDAKAKAEAPVAEPAKVKVETPVVEPVKANAEAPAAEPLKPLAATSTPAYRPTRPIIAKPLPVPPVPAPSSIKLSVARSQDDILGLRHRSQQQLLESLEENDVAWVDEKTLASLHVIDQKASLVMPDGRERAITLKEAALEPAEGRFIILPRKLRNKLSIERGMTVEVKA
jgi:hypothetical protein